MPMWIMARYFSPRPSCRMAVLRGYLRRLIRHSDLLRYSIPVVEVGLVTLVLPCWDLRSDVALA